MSWSRPPGRTGQTGSQKPLRAGAHCVSRLDQPPRADLCSPARRVQLHTRSTMSQGFRFTICQLGQFSRASAPQTSRRQTLRLQARVMARSKYNRGHTSAPVIPRPSQPQTPQSVDQRGHPRSRGTLKCHRKLNGMLQLLC